MTTLPSVWASTCGKISVEPKGGRRAGQLNWTNSVSQPVVSPSGCFFCVNVSTAPFAAHASSIFRSFG